MSGLSKTIKSASKFWPYLLENLEYALGFLIVIMGRMQLFTESTITTVLKPYGVAMKVIGNSQRQITGRWLNNRAKNSHLQFLRRERATLRFRRLQSLQKFVAIHSAFQNHFNQERHLYSRENSKSNRTAALAEWRQLCSE